MKMHFCKSLVLLIFLTACGEPFCFDLCRQPQVVKSRHECVMDYDEAFYQRCDCSCRCGCEQCSSGHCSECRCDCGQCSYHSKGIDRKFPILPEFLDPYQPFATEYRLSVGDVLEISIFGEEDTVVDHATVAPDGMLYYMTLDGVPAEGKTISEVSEEIATHLGELFTNPVVTISPKYITSQSYKILGKVELPGIYPIEGPVRLREAIGEAGGFALDPYHNNYNGSKTSLADLSNSFVVRDNKKLDIDFEKLFYGNDESQNIYLRPSDYIYVASSEVKEVFVVGNVFAPQRLNYIPNLTLMAALTSAGGWPVGDPYSADMHRVLVIRGSLDCPRVAQVNLWHILCGEAKDLCLKPGDIIYVQDKPMRFGRELVRLAVDAFIQSFVGTAAVHYVDSHIFRHNRHHRNKDNDK